MMSNKIKNRRYSKRHLWMETMKESNQAYIGVTDYVIENFSGLDCIDLPLVGEEFEVDTPLMDFHLDDRIHHFRVLLSGRVLEINKDVQSDLGMLFKDPEHNWLLKIEYDSSEEFDSLMNEKQYLDYLDEL